jgi:hypothetical protein
MESTPPSEQLRAAERGEAAPYVRFPPTPWWYSPVVGAWAAAFVGTFACWLGGVAAGAVVAFVTVTAGLAVYERRYAVAAARVRERLR